MTAGSTGRVLSERFVDAFRCAFELHQGQCRKGTSEPYVAHLLAVASLALEHGADEDTGIAALLHDAVEDQGGRPRLEEIRTRFGDRVASIVAACTDDLEEPDWRRRKERYLEHLPHAGEPVILVSAADKLDNVRALNRNFEQAGNSIFARWQGGREARLWYYRRVLEVLEGTGKAGPLVAELGREVRRMEQLIGSPDGEGAPGSSAPRAS